MDMQTVSVLHEPTPQVSRPNTSGAHSGRPNTSGAHSARIVSPKETKRPLAETKTQSQS